MRSPGGGTSSPDKFLGTTCQTRIGIGAPCIVPCSRSDSRVQGDSDRRPVPVCED